ncbi:hypothetical protein ACFQY7_16280 [Actinomadura luteofluorescens]|uniref:hypothetical protein n=1 Tax=Actinomadura luteofluorescens TaxID=46163 RepID=UPI00363BF488
MGTSLPANAGTLLPHHPLGNFTVNHYDGLRLETDRIEDTAIVDSAEIPTLQERGAVDTDRDGTVSAPEAARYAERQCAAAARAKPLTVGNRTVAWRPTATSYTRVPGSAGLPTSRLTCTLSAPATITAATRIHFSDTFRNDRIGWHEITATGKGCGSTARPSPRAASATNCATTPATCSPRHWMSDRQPSTSDPAPARPSHDYPGCPQPGPSPEPSDTSPPTSTPWWEPGTCP